jgi:hypothetical protein
MLVLQPEDTRELVAHLPEPLLHAGLPLLLVAPQTHVRHGRASARSRAANPPTCCARFLLPAPHIYSSKLL